MVIYLSCDIDKAFVQAPNVAVYDDWKATYVSQQHLAYMKVRRVYKTISIFIEQRDHMHMPFIINFSSTTLRMV